MYFIIILFFIYFYYNTFIFIIIFEGYSPVALLNLWIIYIGLLPVIVQVIYTGLLPVIVQVIYTGLLPVIMYPKSQQIRISQLILNLTTRLSLGLFTQVY